MDKTCSLSSGLQGKFEGREKGRDEDGADYQDQAQLLHLQKTGSREASDAAEPCSLCGGLDQSALENMEHQSYTYISAMEEKMKAFSCAGCRVPCWIASDFLARGKGPGWGYGAAILNAERNPIQLIVEASDSNNRFADPRRDRASRGKIYFEIFTTQGVLPASWG
jgi:hypothetical protein